MGAWSWQLPLLSPPPRDSFSERKTNVRLYDTPSDGSSRCGLLNWPCVSSFGLSYSSEFIKLKVSKEPHSLSNACRSCVMRLRDVLCTINQSHGELHAQCDTSPHDSIDLLLSMKHREGFHPVELNFQGEPCDVFGNPCANTNSLIFLCDSLAGLDFNLVAIILHCRLSLDIVAA